MPITELIFPVWKTDPQSVANLKQSEPQIFKHFSGLNGLEAGFRGSITEANGAVVKPESLKTMLVLEWADVSSFHKFYPESSEFQALIQSLKPYVNAPAVPELYESQSRSISATSAAVTQMVKTTLGGETEHAWEQLEKTIGELAGDKPSFYYAKGILKDQGTFLGMIGWKSLEEYEQVGKHVHVLEQVKKLNQEGAVESLVVQLADWVPFEM
ncbi:hypothetical protein BJX70DRAFT_393663 [Aspergillus crustosus]